MNIQYKCVFKFDDEKLSLCVVPSLYQVQPLTCRKLEKASFIYEYKWWMLILCIRYQVVCWPKKWLLKRILKGIARETRYLSVSWAFPKSCDSFISNILNFKSNSLLTLIFLSWVQMNCTHTLLFFKILMYIKCKIRHTEGCSVMPQYGHNCEMYQVG